MDVSRLFGTAMRVIVLAVMGLVVIGVTIGILLLVIDALPV